METSARATVVFTRVLHRSAEIWLMLLPTRTCKDPWKPKVILHIDRHPIKRKNFISRETTGTSGKSFAFFDESKGFHPMGRIVGGTLLYQLYLPSISWRIRVHSMNKKNTGYPWLGLFTQSGKNQPNHRTHPKMTICQRISPGKITAFRTSNLLPRYFAVRNTQIHYPADNIYYCK